MLDLTDISRSFVVLFHCYFHDSYIVILLYDPPEMFLIYMFSTGRHSLIEDAGLDRPKKSKYHFPAPLSQWRRTVHAPRALLPLSDQQTTMVWYSMATCHTSIELNILALPWRLLLVWRQGVLWSYGARKTRGVWWSYGAGKCYGLWFKMK